MLAWITPLGYISSKVLGDFLNYFKWYQHLKEQVRMGTLASHEKKKDFCSFWKATNKLNIKPAAIANICLWSILELSRRWDPQGRRSVLKLVRRWPSHALQRRYIYVVIQLIISGKSPVHDSLSIEHLQHVESVCMLFNLCIGYSYLPEEIIKIILIPIVINRPLIFPIEKNYRPISLATVISKVFDAWLTHDKPNLANCTIISSVPTSYYKRGLVC